MSISDETFIRRAIELARHSVAVGGGPFGSVVVRNGEMIGEGWNRVTQDNDPTAHAEVVAIRDACRRTGNFQLTGCTIYASCEPCPMCLGAIYWARPERIVIACDRSDAAKAGFDDAFIYDELDLRPEERSIPVIRMMREEGLAVFTDWLDKGDKTEY